MDIFSLAGWTAWVITVIVMLAKPLSILFKGLFIKILPYRQWLGITLSLFAILHVVLFVIRVGDVSFFFDPGYWNFTTFTGWGVLSFVVMLPLFVTSNKLSMKLLKKNWKRIQLLAYVFFIAVGLHIYLANGQWYFSLLPIGIWLLLYIIAFIKLRSSKEK